MADDRRSFLRWCTHGLGAVFGVILGFPAVAYLLDARNRKATDSTFRRVGGIRLSEVALGRPVQGVIRDVRQDAWTLHPNDVVGRVWVIRTRALPADGPDDASNFQVFTTVCPHLGCSINLISEPRMHFKCPCHDAEFHTDGEREQRDGYTNASPRDMDSLNFRIERDPDHPNPNNRDLLLVEYQRFVQTVPEKEVRL